MTRCILRSGNPFKHYMENFNREYDVRLLIGAVVFAVICVVVIIGTNRK
jgi:hypothetical protein